MGLCCSDGVKDHLSSALEGVCDADAHFLDEELPAHDAYGSELTGK